MQRWFFLEDPNNALTRYAREETPSESLKVDSKIILKKWLFRVTARDLKPEEVVCITGSPAELGSWLAEKCIPLEKEEEDVWSVCVDIPDGKIVEYRFCVCVIIEPGIQVIVRNWETAITPRIIEGTDISPTKDDEPLLYGVIGYHKVDRGWLNKETLVQLKLCNNPLTLWRPRYVNRKVYIKVTPVSLQKPHNNITSNVMGFEDSLSADTTLDNSEGTKHSYTEVASLQDEDPSFHLQDQFGKEYRDDEMLIFQSTVLFPQNIAFLIDLYIYSSKSNEGEPPYHAGFSYLLPSCIQQSEGTVILPVTSTKHRPLGEIRIEYLVIKPMPNFHCDMSISYLRHWDRRRSGLDVGHRGSGSSFKTKNCAEVRENTIASLKNAIHYGADYVEFDVQLSKDKVPIIYHDFHVCIAMKKKNTVEETDMLELPVKDLTLEQLRMLKVYHLSEGKSKNPRFFDDELEEHQPFPTLHQVLEQLNPHVGFNIEIKWTMQLYDGSYELYHPTDLNLYLDTILEVVLRYGGKRRIVFSCFNADCCAMIRMKQNKYPVMFLTQGETVHYPRYNDPRCWSIKSAAQYGAMVELLGINVHTEDLLRDPSLIRYATMNDLIIFCWGDDNSNPDTIKYLKELGLHGVIYDKIYQYNSKEIKESIFLVEARESQKALLRLAERSAESPSAPPPPVVVPVDNKFDIEGVRHDLGDKLSTATSLESLESRMSDYEKRGGQMV